jgi:hypothetical protein
MAKQPKDEVDYSPGHKESHCGPAFSQDRFYCRHFEPGPRAGFDAPGHCRKVAGSISRTYWCKLYRKVDS